MKKSTLCLLILTVLQLCSAIEATGQLLIRRKMYSSPETWVLNKGFANSHWNKDLYCQPTSMSLSYVARDSSGTTILSHTISIATDGCWNRLLVNDQTQGQNSRLREHGCFGFGLDSLFEPMAVKVFSPTSDQNWYASHYDIFVADRSNHRVEKLRYRWTTPDSGLIHLQYLTGNLWRPTDLDVSNSRSYDNYNDDVVWVACKNDKIMWFHEPTGYQLGTYGSHGSGTGQFNDIRAIVCAKNRNASGVWFANDTLVYVLDAGNNRIVRLTYPTLTTVRWDTVYVNTFCGTMTDLEVDACGHIWATADDGYIYKFTADLDPLGVFGSEGTGANQFDYPVSIANTGGHLGGGDVIICENWTTESGIQHYAIGTDVANLFVNTVDMNDSICYAYISFLLADYSSVTINIRNYRNVIIKQLRNSVGFPAGVVTELWNGRNSSNARVAKGTNLTVEIIASSLYKDSDGQPVNTVTRTATFKLCNNSTCVWNVGDANGDGTVDISDAVYLVTFIFAGGAAPTPHPIGSGDADCSQSVDISDPVYLINRIFNGGPPPGPCTCADYYK